MRRKQIYRNMPLFSKILLWMLIVSIIPLITVGVFSMVRLTRLENERCESEIRNNLNWIDSRTTELIDNFRLLTIRMTIELMDANPITDRGDFDSARVDDLKKMLSLGFPSRYCDSSFFVGNTGSTVTNSVDTDLQERIREQVRQYRNSPASENSIAVWGSVVRSGDRYVIPHIRKACGAHGESIGYIVANLSEKMLEALSRSNMASGALPAEDVLFLIDGRVVSAWDKALIGKTMDQLDPSRAEGRPTFSRYGGKTCAFVTGDSAGVSGWSYAVVVSRAVIHESSRRLIGIFVIVLLVGLLFIFGISWLVSRSISKPMEYLSGAMLDIGNHNLDTKLKNPQYHDEVGQMWASLIKMTELLKKAQIESQEAIEQIQRLRFEALKAQINPHFLYNTFASIIYLIESDKKQEAKGMLTALAELLHISISRSREYITVEEELKLIRDYMDIQRVRFQNAFRYIIDVDIDVMKLPVVKVILQPAIENVLEHGLIHKKDETATIRITGRREGGRIILCVIDNCGGLTEERMRQVNETIASRDTQAASAVGIGLKNVHDRVCHEFPEDAELGVSLRRKGNLVITQIVTRIIEEPKTNLPAERRGAE